MQKNETKLQAFLRRKGNYLAGGVMAAAFIGLMILGANVNITIGEDYIYTKKVQEKVLEKVDSYLSEHDNNTWDSYYGIKELGLRYDAHIAALDGEMFVYNVEFDRTVTDDTVSQLKEQIVKKCGVYSEDNNYGEYMIEKTGEKSLRVILDLGNATDAKAITGIFRALDDIDGVVKAVVNDYNTPAASSAADKTA